MAIKILLRLRKSGFHGHSVDKQAKPTNTIVGPKRNIVDITMSGAYVSTRKIVIPRDDDATTATTLESDSTTSLHDSISITAAGWHTSGSKTHHQGSPLVACDHDQRIQNLALDDIEVLGKIMARSRRLPTTWYYSSNHVMVNQARAARTVAPLFRLKELDELAREHAGSMAVRAEMYYMDPVMLHIALDRPSSRYGTNVARGSSISDIHKAMMQNVADKNNILDRRYSHFGMAAVRGQNGELFLAQIFRG